jgi:hypothetical protein
LVVSNAGAPGGEVFGVDGAGIGSHGTPSLSRVAQTTALRGPLCLK